MLRDYRGRDLLPGATMANSSNLSCPDCQAALKLCNPLPIGREFGCPKCKTILCIEMENRRPVVQFADRTRRPAPRQRRTRERTEASPRSAKRSKIVVAVVFTLLFCLGGTAVAYVCFVQSRTAGPAQVADLPSKKTVMEQPAAGTIQKQSSSGETPIAPKQQPAQGAAVQQPQAEPAPVKPAPEPPLTPEMIKQRLLDRQKKIDTAIARGIEFLKTEPEGKSSHPIGRAALRGLTLLECGVPPDHPLVQQIALMIRNAVPTLRQTYDSSLALLFLDRLGEPRDILFIQVLGLRLTAAQTMSGGWSYTVPALEIPEMQQLITFLHYTRPKLKVHTPLVKNEPPPFLVPLPERSTLQKPLPNEQLWLPIPLDGKDGVATTRPLARDPLLALETFLGAPDPLESTNPPAPEPKKADVAAEVKKDITTKPDEAPKPSFVYPPQSPKEKVDPKPATVTPKAPQDKPMPEKPAVRPKTRDIPKIIHPQMLAKRLRELPVVVGQTTERGKIYLPDTGRDDNSNSQFALLATWAARRYGVATERPLFFAEQRYRQWQNKDGGWGYQRDRASTAAMTGVGLLGLAMGHGADFEPTVKEVDMAPGYTDPAIERGLARFATFIGNLEPENKKAKIQNLYFLWSVERVAMLYKLRSIGGKDWYGWGSQGLLANQNDDGSWVSASYPGSHDKTVDTCFALLFLRRSNLVEDLASNITQRIAVEAKTPAAGKN